MDSNDVFKGCNLLCLAVEEKTVQRRKGVEERLSILPLFFQNLC